MRGYCMYKEEEIQNKMISIQEIQKILDYYCIGKKPLAKLLGWGETTIIRYMEGDIPTSEYSDKLLLILNNPNYFYELLLKNQSKITPVAYRKSKNAVMKRMLDSKSTIVAQYIINQKKGMTYLYEMERLLFYIQGFSLALSHAPFIEELYYNSADHLPYAKITKAYQNRYLSMMELGDLKLLPNEVELIHHVIDAFSSFGVRVFELLEAYECIHIKNSTDEQVYELGEIEAYFKEQCEKYHIKTMDQIKLYPKEVLRELKMKNQGQ